MKNLRIELEKLRKKERKKYHPIKTKIRKKYGISRKTLFYVKEYGAHSNIPKTIIKESIRILLLASILSSMGGFTMEKIKLAFITIVPLVILFPTLNDMLGDYGAIISSRFTTLLYTGKIKGKWFKNEHLKNLFLQVFIVAIVTAIISTISAIVISHFSGFSIYPAIIYKIISIGIIDTIIMTTILFMIAILGGLYIYHRHEDADNFLIPITTSVADFGNMILLFILFRIMF